MLKTGLVGLNWVGGKIKEKCALNGLMKETSGQQQQENKEKKLQGRNF